MNTYPVHAARPNYTGRRIGVGVAAIGTVAFLAMAAPGAVDSLNGMECYGETTTVGDGTLWELAEQVSVDANVADVQARILAMNPGLDPGNITGKIIRHPEYCER